MDLSVTAFSGYLSGISSTPIVASHEVTTQLTPAIVNRSGVLYQLLKGLAQRHPDKTVSHYYGLYGTIVLLNGQQYGSFISIRSRENVKSSTLWVTTLEGGLMVKQYQTHTPYSDVGHVGASVTTALVWQMRHGALEELQQFNLNLYSFFIPKSSARPAIPPPHSSEPGRTPTSWHC